MRKLTVLSMITLDGVMQAPGGPEEDTSGGFEWGGWVAPFSNDEYNRVVGKELQDADYLLGRKTFEMWAGYWPAHGDFWPGINKGMKWVYSSSLENTDPIVAGWNNSAVIKGVEEIRKIKATDGPDIQVWGSSELVPLLLQHDLVDELRLKIHPVTLGKGKKLFGDGASAAAFTLTESIVTSTGVLMVTYRRAGQVQTGRVGV